MIDTIKLCLQNGIPIHVKLNTEKKPYSAEEILKVSKRVYEDGIYWFELGKEIKYDSLSVYVNGSKLRTICENEKIMLFTEDESPSIFLHQIGFVQLSFCFSSEGIEEWYYSEYLSVLVHMTRTNRTIDNMLSYIYDNQSEFLMSNGSIAKSLDYVGSGMPNDFKSQVDLLKEIVGIYENCYGFFKVNSRCKLDTVFIVDNADRLQTIGDPTIRYMIQHPEQLRESPKGIRVGRQVFLPDKALTIQNKISQDIYENRVVVGFLRKVVEDSKSLEKRINDYKNNISNIDTEEGGYLISAAILYHHAYKVLDNYGEELNNIRNKLERLLVSYNRIINVDPDRMQLMPRPTAIFMSVPQYHMIYTCMMSWYGRLGYELENEKTLLNIQSASVIYEIYVLVKIIRFLMSRGFSLTESTNVRYPVATMWGGVNKEYNNTFLFQKDNTTITLFYEPVIYDTPKNLNKIHLYRNNTVSISEETDEERVGHYYTPDYLIKVERDGVARYYICDAKFSKQDNVRYKLMPGLVYKYLYSISPADDSDIIGMSIVYALNDDSVSPLNFYDREKGKKIYPVTNIVPVSAEMQEYEIDRCLDKIFEELIE